MTFYSDDDLDFEYSSPFEYQQQKKELFRYGHCLDTPYPHLAPNSPSVLSPSPPSVLTDTTPEAAVESGRGLEATLSPGVTISKELKIEDLLVGFEEERK